MLTENNALARVVTVRDYVELTKPRIVVMVVLTTIAGFYMATAGALDSALLLYTALGTMLVVASANALNQLAEKEVDALMVRTENRPLPAGRMSSQEAALAGAIMFVVGMLFLGLGVNLYAAFLALVAWVNYVFFYTPLKRRSTVSTIVGAVSGAIPPVIGWLAVRPGLGPESLVLFLILFLWQFPHFMAIAWIYRDDYSRAGIRVLPLVDGGVGKTGGQIVGYGLALVPVCLMPTLLGVAGQIYFFGALVLAMLFLGFGIRMAVAMSDRTAKQLLYMSLLFLPAIFALMTLDKRHF